MVGNDIVDLAEAKRASNWQRPRFLEKLFTPNEQQYIQNSDNPFLTVWQLWSMKEATYKLYTQLNPSRFYNPKSFECSFQNENQKVRFKDFEFFVQSRITSKYIISEARLNPFKMNSEVIPFNVKDYKSQSGETKAALMERISKTYQVPISKLKFQKSEFGIPSVSFDSDKINVSISHHGIFGAYAFESTVIPAKAGIS
ncbi:4'-phosphopantetheinyl transferase family protein [Winogradskyella ursingii]|uniref:4'-phosphopantetheinyl transferase family protein n=1 Tax=Winogradskyella ursingii TaxID=2686079 RepID=UPI0015C7355F|nr:4'-phosphopantetheinyl transferase superfamily protein [Winogradskyella ursingii]